MNLYGRHWLRETGGYFGYCIWFCFSHAWSNFIDGNKPQRFSYSKVNPQLCQSTSFIKGCRNHFDDITVYCLDQKSAVCLRSMIYTTKMRSSALKLYKAPLIDWVTTFPRCSENKLSCFLTLKISEGTRGISWLMSGAGNTQHRTLLALLHALGRSDLAKKLSELLENSWVCRKFLMLKRIKLLINTPENML